MAKTGSLPGLLCSSVAAFVLLAGAVTSAETEEGNTLAEVVVDAGRTRWTSNNRVELLADPRRAWEARLDLLEAARNHIFISTYSWHENTYGTRFRNELARVVSSRKSVNEDFTVRCLADATGMKMFSRAFNDLRKTGAVVRSYNRQSWGMAPVFDGRMHDKLMITDGRKAIVGGRNYSDIYFDPQRWWLDFGVLVEGSAVWELQMIFLKSWAVSEDLLGAQHFGWSMEDIRRRIRSLWSTGRFPDGESPLEEYLNEGFFPDYESPPGETKVAVLYDNSMVWHRAPTAAMLVELVEAAETEIDIMTPFPNFEEVLTRALADAVKRGVHVRLITNDREAAIRGGWIRLAAFPTLIELAESGVEIWAWKANPKLLAEVAETGCAPAIMPPIALHGKVVRIDDELTIVHSSNFNIRSTYYNTEAGLVVLDHGLNREVRALLDRLISLHDLRISCQDGLAGITVENVVYQLTDLPLAEDVPIAFGSVRTGRREAEWRADAPATLCWAEALDGGDAGAEAEENASQHLPGEQNLGPAAPGFRDLRFFGRSLRGRHESFLPAA